MSIPALATAIAVVFLVAPQAQVGRPDLSGKWTIRSGVGGHGYAMVFSGEQLSIVQNKTTITVSRPHGQNLVSLVLPLSGEEKTMSVPALLRGRTGGNGAATFRSRAKWDGEQLVVTNTQRVTGAKGDTLEKQIIETLKVVPPGYLVISRTYGDVMGTARGSLITEQDIYQKSK